MAQPFDKFENRSDFAVVRFGLKRDPPGQVRHLRRELFQWRHISGVAMHLHVAQGAEIAQQDRRVVAGLEQFRGRGKADRIAVHGGNHALRRRQIRQPVLSVAQVEVERQAHRLKVDLFLRLRFIRRALVTQKTVERGKQRICLRLGFTQPVTAGAHQIGKMIRRLIKHLERLGRDVQPSGAYLVQDGFVPVGEPHQKLQPECPRAALDRMDRPENDIDRLFVVSAVGHDLQAVLKGFEQFLALNEKGRADFRHGVVLITHHICPLSWRSSARP